MTTITPMKRLKTYFDKLEVLTKIKATNLNKAQPKTHYPNGYFYESNTTKGVENEFIRIYPIVKEKSFAFAFNNIKDDTSKVLVTTSIKEQNDIISSTCTFDEFKIQLKEFITALEIVNSISNKIDKSNYISIVSKIFKLNQPNKTQYEIIETIKQEILEVSTPIKKDIKANNKILKKVVSLLDKKQLEESFLIKNLKQELNYAKVKAEWDSVNLQIKERTQEIRTQHHYDKLNETRYQSENKNRLLTNKLDNAIYEVLSKYPSSIRNKIKS